MPESGSSLASSASDVGSAQLDGKVLECRNAAGFGALAPGLQLAGQLLAAQAGIEPQLTQLFAHDQHLVNHRVRSTRLRQLALGTLGHLVGIAVQPALHALEQRNIRLLRLPLLEQIHHAELPYARRAHNGP